jgi:serine/threonine protein kinase
LIGKKLAHYEIVSMLGKGGMGEVFRARDTKLGREVALKILPKELSGDPERAARFQREARSLAMLQHPNVATIYGFEEADGIRFLVMELVDGEELGARMEQGALRTEEVRRIAKQMAAGLEAAHESGLVHRDLKPANVMLTGDGEAKILDFGLARAWFGDQTDGENIEASPTITAAMTQAGTILGTAAYMSPEQARGRNVDRRADIWAFGVILFEMLTGQRLFEGETVSDTLAAVLRAEPDWDLLPVEDAPDLCQLIERCLVRDPKQRLRDIGEARLLLEGGASMSRLSMPRAELPEDFDDARPAKTKLGLTLALAALALLIGVGVGWKLLPGEEVPEARVLHTMIPAPPETSFDLSSAAPGPARISPDGTKVVFTARDSEGVTRLYLRHLDRSEAVMMPGTHGSAYPFWSPDSQNIGFFTPNIEQKLKKVAIAGGPPITLCTSFNGKGGAWGPDGTIVFAPSHDTGLSRVPDIGGVPDTLTVKLPNQDSHRHPRFLPDGRSFVFVTRSSPTSEVYDVLLGSLDGGEPRLITRSEAQAEVSHGHILTAFEGILLATPIDMAAVELTGGGFPIVENIMIPAGTGAGVFSISDDGLMVFQTGASTANRVLEWIEIESGARTTFETEGQFSIPRVSPTGTHAIIEVVSESAEGVDLWLLDLGTGLRTRFTFGSEDEMFGVWSPDGRDVYYLARQEDTNRVFRQTIDGAGGAVPVFEGEDRIIRLDDISPDGTRLLVSGMMPGGSFSLATIALDGSGEMQFLDNEGLVQGGGRYSPDGRWIAYHGSTQSRWDVFIRPADGSARKWQVTTDGSVWPQWSPDGGMLYVNGFTGDIIAYSISPSGEGIVIGSSRTVAVGRTPSAQGTDNAIDPTGSRFLSVSNSSAENEQISHLNLVTDWRRALGR